MITSSPSLRLPHITLATAIYSTSTSTVTMDYTVKYVTTEAESVLTTMKDFIVSINTANLVAATLQKVSP